MKNLAIVPLMAIILLFTMPQAFGAWGVSEKSVKKWEPKKLCEKSAELEIKKDWKAVAIIAKEIAARPDIDSSVCMDISKEREKEIASKKKARLGPKAHWGPRPIGATINPYHASLLYNIIYIYQ